MLPEEQLKEVLQNFKKKVDPIIDEILVSEIHHKFEGIVKYQVHTGGKRLRPALAIMSAKLLKGRLDNVAYPAAGLEILHNYTLIVDDIIDHGLLRRNKPTLWAKYGESIAECVAIAYASSVYQTAPHSPSPSRIAMIFSKALKDIMIEGEIQDILFERLGRENESYITKHRPKAVNKSQYIEMARNKTASLFEACCEIGGVCAKGTKTQIQNLKDFGLNLGLAFQIQDDILDIFGDAKKFGKQIGKDIEERKGGNIVLLLAFQELDKKRKDKIDLIMKHKDIKEKEIKNAIKLIEETKSRERAMDLAETFIQKAKISLQKLPKNKWNNTMASLADFVITRTK